MDYNGAPENIGIYVVAQYYDAQTNTYQYVVSRAELADRDAANAGELEPEWVDPDAQPCPAGG
ncbi:hypothetical protein [Brevundimonas sp.]|uniref:hypothetical protein n=1 Tax=Brevundimonas sp. TaxID=1871086 RepID=UPI002D415103|nr:hypothetical protein [Brevundimonas sp.]HYD27403.1 hypothetical protein [Brevundimonas sp.]